MQTNPTVSVLLIDKHAKPPKYAYLGTYGDLAADVFSCETISLAAGETRPVRTGVALGFPETHGALVEDRSGLAVRGVTTLAGVIDPGYRGELKIVMTNLSAVPVEIQAGDRIAQLRIVQRIQAEFEVVDSLENAPRGERGFGSTGR